MARGDRANRLRDQAQFEVDLQIQKEKWLSSVQNRQSRSASDSIDILDKSRDSQLTMVERVQKMAIERAKLQMAINKHRMEIAEKWLQLNIEGEQLINMRNSRKEYSRALSHSKRKLARAKKYAAKITRWSEHWEDIAWGEFCNPQYVTAVWRSFTCLLRECPRSLQREVACTELSWTAVELHNFCRPGHPDYKPTNKCSNHYVLGIARYCYKHKYLPRCGSELQNEFFKIATDIDKNLAIMGAEHQTHTEQLQAELLSLREKHWTRHKVI